MELLVSINFSSCWLNTEGGWR